MARKAYIPLESNPEVFTELIHNLGVSKNLAFQDVYSLDDPDILSFVPRPAMALVLVFPPSQQFKQQKKEREDKREPYNGKGESEDVVWFRQTIYNACGLYGLLHAVSNGEARNHIEPNSVLANLLTACIPLAPDDRAAALENSEEVQKAHYAAAIKGDSTVPESAEDEVPYHYICFVPSAKNGHLYEMDGDCKGPVDRGDVLGPTRDLLDESSLRVVREFMAREGGDDIGFSLMALVVN